MTTEQLQRHVRDLETRVAALERKAERHCERCRVGLVEETTHRCRACCRDLCLPCFEASVCSCSSGDRHQEEPR